MDVILYSTNCPKCKVLESKLNKKGINFTIITDVQEMCNLGMMSAPNLKVDEKIMSFKEAANWINEQ